jgi:hypothetical protein
MALTKKERKEWFEQVKGKPIRWHSWPNGMYFIPHSHTSMGLMMNGIDENGRVYEFAIAEGYNIVYGMYWEPCYAVSTKLGKLYYGVK